MPEAVAAESVAEALGRAVDLLRQAGCETPRLDAELLLAEALGVSRAQLVLDAAAAVGERELAAVGERELAAVGERELAAVGERELAQFDQLLARRARREPVAYILGRKDFRWITLSVDRRALIPRPETELLVEAASVLPTGASVVDVGTGSGAVALALKHERPDLRVSGTDISPDAVALARSNAAALGIDVVFKVRDLLGGLACEAVVANLPYVAHSEPLAPEIARYEPGEALFAGADGLDVIRRFVATLPSRVSFVALEVGAGQAAPVSALLAETGFDRSDRLRDLAGHERVVVARR